MNNITSDLLQHAIYPFLCVGDLLELGQVNRHFHNDTEDYFDQYQHGRKEGYFHRSCKLICSQDLSTLAGLLLSRWDTFRRNKETRKLFFLDEWPNDYIVTAPMLDHMHATSWRSVCLWLLDRIQTIAQREKTVLTVEPKIPSVATWLIPRTIAQHLPKQLGGFCESHTPKISAYFVVGSGSIGMFHDLCFEKGLADTDVEPFIYIGLRSFLRATLPVQTTPLASNKIQRDVECNIVGAEYGPAGYNPQDCSEYSLLLLTKRKRGSLSFCPDFLVWGVAVDSSMESGTPYRFTSYWHANRAALKEFILARGCPCKVLLIVVMLDQNSLPVSAPQVENHLGLSILSKFGIQWHIQMCQGSVNHTGRPSGRSLEGGAKGLEWAVSQFC